MGATRSVLLAGHGATTELLNKWDALTFELKRATQAEQVAATLEQFALAIADYHTKTNSPYSLDNAYCQRLIRDICHCADKANSQVTSWQKYRRFEAHNHLTGQSLRGMAIFFALADDSQNPLELGLISRETRGKLPAAVATAVEQCRSRLGFLRTIASSIVRYAMRGEKELRATDISCANQLWQRMQFSVLQPALEASIPINEQWFVDWICEYLTELSAYVLDHPMQELFHDRHPVVNKLFNMAHELLFEKREYSPLSRCLMMIETASELDNGKGKLHDIFIKQSRKIPGFKLRTDISKPCVSISMAIADYKNHPTYKVVLQQWNNKYDTKGDKKDTLGMRIRNKDTQPELSEQKIRQQVTSTAKDIAQKYASKESSFISRFLAWISRAVLGKEPTNYSAEDKASLKAAVRNKAALLQRNKLEHDAAIVTTSSVYELVDVPLDDGENQAAIVACA